METTEDLATMDFGELAPAEVPVRYRGEEYVLVEPDEATAVKYRNRQVSSVRVEDGKMAGVSGVGELQAFLVSLCLFRLTPGDERKPGRSPVSYETVMGWQAKVVRQLHARAVKLGDLEERETQASLKNGRGGSPPTSQ